MSSITYTVGDATSPLPTNHKSAIICHVCNDKGGWGRGFVLALSAKWPGPECLYRKWATTFVQDWPKFQLGAIQLVEVETNLFVANMIAQHDVKWIGDIPPVRYDRVRQCLNKVAKMALETDAAVHMPDLIGCGLAGGHRKTMIGIIEETLLKNNIDVFIYNLQG